MLRLGVDIVDIARLQDRMTNWPRLVDRLFTQAEQDYCNSRSHPEQHFAARVAAKEAAFKALGEGWPALHWTDVEVTRDGGKPALALYGRAADRAGDCQTAVSLAHDAGVAIASVILVG